MKPPPRSGKSARTATVSVSALLHVIAFLEDLLHATQDEFLTDTGVGKSFHSGRMTGLTAAIESLHALLPAAADTQIHQEARP